MTRSERQDERPPVAPTENNCKSLFFSFASFVFCHVELALSSRGSVAWKAAPPNPRGTKLKQQVQPRRGEEEKNKNPLKR